MEPDVLTEEGAKGYVVAKFVMLFVVISFVLIRLLDLVIGLLDLVIGWLMPIIAPVFGFMFLLFGLIVIANFAMSSQYMTCGVLFGKVWEPHPFISTRGWIRRF